MTIERHLVYAALATTIALALAACAPTPAPQASQRPSRAAAGQAPRVAAPVAPWTLPTQAGTQPDLAVAPDGSLLLSWVEEAGSRRSLRFARWTAAGWSPAHTVASGDWFGNAFDTPQIEQTQDGALWTTWMRASPAGGHARDVVIARSGDGGATWSAPQPVNTDGTATEHGFVSLWRASPDSIGVAWLDGRAKGGEGHAMHGGDHADMQMLRSALFDARLQRRDEATIDSTVCDCCHTAVATAASGPVLVYRDRTSAEVRDVHAAVLRNGAWRDTGAVHADRWVMPGCPVNGPSAAADGDRVVTLWYTAAGGTPSVRYAASSDGGVHFGDAHTLVSDAGALGRVAVASDGAAAWFAWLDEADGRQRLRVARREWSAPDASAPRTLATLATHGNGAGMPRLAATRGATYAVWTDSANGAARLVGTRL
jgi:hypothetical protein